MEQRAAFWARFSENEAELKKLLLNRTYEDHTKAREIIDNIIKEFDLTGKIGILFGVDVRNSFVLPERKDYIELIITPLYQRKYKHLVSELASQVNLPGWSIIKYKYWQPSQLETITISYKDVEIKKEHFTYHPIIDHKIYKLNLILFVNDKIADYMIKKETHVINGNSREIWVPKDYGIYAILDSAVGEYNLLNYIENMEIYLESEEKDIERHEIKKLTDTITMIVNNPMSDMHNCSRCGYSNRQVILKLCKCKNVYYCDNICQKAHRTLHKLNCS
jgi:hypothetical protein